MSAGSKEEYVHQVFENISQVYDRANVRISLGFQGRWKSALVRRLCEYIPFGTSLLDLCCGTGDIALAAAKKRPDLKVVGADFSASMLAVAAEKSRGLKNVHWTKADAMDLAMKNDTYDAVCISFGLRNTADYKQVLSEMRRVAKDGGFIYCLDSFVPGSKFVRPFYEIYFRYIMPLIGGGKKHKQEYRWLWRSTRRFLSRKDLEDLYRDVGLRDIGHRDMMFGACSLVWGQK